MSHEANRWRFILADANDLRVHIGELFQARGRSVNTVLNRGGSISFTFPMREEMAAEIQPITTAVKCYRWSDKTESWRNIISGPVWTIDEQINDERMTVNCIGWQEILNKRLLRMDKIYNDVDDGAIIQDLLAEANKLVLPDIAGYAVPVPSVYPATPSKIGWGGTRPNEGPGGATAYATALRNKTYQKYVSIGSLIDELTALENGCDIHIDPDTRLLYVHRKKMRDTNEVFAYGWGPSNLQSFQRQYDASTVVNLMQVTGRSGSTPQYADTHAPFPGWPGDIAPDSQLEYGLIDELMNLPDVIDNNVLGAYAAGEIFVRYRPRVIYNLTPFSYAPGGMGYHHHTGAEGIPEPFEDYDVGDRVRLTALLPPRVAIQNQAVRVFGISVNIDDNGNESISSLQTAPG